MKNLSLEILGEAAQPIGHFANDHIPVGYCTTDEAAMTLGITQLQVWDLMKNGVIAYMSNEFTYAVRVTDLNHLLMVDRVERHSKEVEEWERWK